MGIQENRRPSIPSWVVMDHLICRKDLDSFREDELTSATGCDSNGDPVRVSFILSSVPGTSRLFVHCPEGRDLSCFDVVVAAHGNAVLFRLEIDFKNLHPSHRAIDYFVYRAYPLGPKVSLVPRCYSTTNEMAAAEEGSWRRSQYIRRMANCRRIGLLRTGDSEEFVVAVFHLNLVKLEDDEDAPLEGELFRLRSDCGEWEVKHTSVRDGKATFRDIYGWWEPRKVVPYRNYLCWVDYSRGVFFCNVNHDNPELHYLSLPVGCVSPGYTDHFSTGLPQVSRAVCVTKVENMKFINVICKDGMLSVEGKPGSSFAIEVSTLVHHDDNGDMTWQKDVTIESHQLWAMEGFDGDKLPRIVPQFPMVSMDNPKIIYFVLRERHSCDAETWVVTLEMDSNKVLSYKDIKALPEEDADMASYNIFCNAPFFPSDFSKYLQRAQEEA